MNKVIKTGLLWLCAASTPLALYADEKRSNLEGILSNSGKIQLVNNSNCDVVVGKRSTSHQAVFLGSFPTQPIAPGEQLTIEFNVDKGPYAAAGADANVRCQAELDVGFGVNLWRLFNGNHLLASFDSEAGCEANLNAEIIGGYGVLPSASIIYSLDFSQDKVTAHPGATSSEFRDIHAQGILSLHRASNTSISLGGQIKLQTKAQSKSPTTNTWTNVTVDNTLEISRQVNVAETTGWVTSGTYFPKTKIEISGQCIKNSQ